MDLTIFKNLKEFNNLNNERVCWIRLSIFVVIVFLLILISWNFIFESRTIYILFASGILVSIIWWYWTMRLIKKIIRFKILESEVLEEIVVSLREIKKDIRKNLNQDP